MIAKIFLTIALRAISIVRSSVTFVEEKEALGEITIFIILYRVIDADYINASWESNVCLLLKIFILCVAAFDINTRSFRPRILLNCVCFANRARMSKRLITSPSCYICNDSYFRQWDDLNTVSHYFLFLYPPLSFSLSINTYDSKAVNHETINGFSPSERPIFPSDYLWFNDRDIVCRSVYIFRIVPVRRACPWHCYALPSRECRNCL